MEFFTPMISAAYILDKTKNLKESLESVKDFCQEIVCVIDTRSKEYREVKEICQGYANKILDYDWASDSFADARNYCIDNCSGDWIFTIDGDETLESYEMPNYEKDYYMAFVINKVNGKDKLYPSIRLFKNIPEIRYQNARHESVESDILNMQMGVMSLNIRHFGYEGIDMKPKLLELLDRHIKQLVEEPENVALRYHIAKSYYGLENWQNCIDWCMMSLCVPINNEAKAQVCVMMYYAYKNLNKEPIGLVWLDTSLQILPQQFTSNLELYKHFERTGNVEAQRKYLENVLQTFITGTRFPNDTIIDKAVVNQRLGELNNVILS